MESKTLNGYEELRLVGFVRDGVDAVIVTRPDGTRFVRFEDGPRAISVDPEKLRKLVDRVDRMR